MSKKVFCTSSILKNHSIYKQSWDCFLFPAKLYTTQRQYIRAVKPKTVMTSCSMQTLKISSVIEQMHQLCPLCYTPQPSAFNSHFMGEFWLTSWRKRLEKVAQLSTHITKPTNTKGNSKLWSITHRPYPFFTYQIPDENSIATLALF